MEALTLGRKKQIPRQITLGLNQVIAIKHVAPSVIAGIANSTSSAVWDYANKTIWIDKTASLTRKWVIYRHELIHAIIDIDAEERGGI